MEGDLRGFFYPASSSVVLCLWHEFCKHSQDTNNRTHTNTDTHTHTNTDRQDTQDKVVKNPSSSGPGSISKFHIKITSNVILRCFGSQDNCHRIRIGKLKSLRVQVSDGQTYKFCRRAEQERVAGGSYSPLSSPSICDTYA